MLDNPFRYSRIIMRLIFSVESTRPTTSQMSLCLLVVGQRSFAQRSVEVATGRTRPCAETDRSTPVTMIAQIRECDFSQLNVATRAFIVKHSLDFPDRDCLPLSAIRRGNQAHQYIMPHCDRVD